MHYIDKKSFEMFKMGKLFLKISLLIFFDCTSTSAPNNAEIHFYYQEYYFGTIPYRKVSGHDFEITNPGKIPLVISKVETSCGCTAADWTKKPVKPNAKGVIKIHYEPTSQGFLIKR